MDMRSKRIHSTDNEYFKFTVYTMYTP